MDSEDLLFILYTSGSTGKPKGVAHTTAGYLLYAAMTHKTVFDIQASKQAARHTTSPDSPPDLDDPRDPIRQRETHMPCLPTVSELAGVPCLSVAGERRVRVRGGLRVDHGPQLHRE